MDVCVLDLTAMLLLRVDGVLVALLKLPFMPSPTFVFWPLPPRDWLLWGAAFLLLLWP